MFPWSTVKLNFWKCLAVCSYSPVHSGLTTEIDLINLTQNCKKKKRKFKLWDTDYYSPLYHWPKVPFALLLSFGEDVNLLSIPSQRMWKTVVSPVQPPCPKQSWTEQGTPAECWTSTRMETPQTLQAISSSIWSPSLNQLFLMFKWNCLYFDLCPLYDSCLFTPKSLCPQQRPLFYFLRKWNICM